LSRECFTEILMARGIDMQVKSFASIEAWRAKKLENGAPAAIILSLGGRKVTEPAIEDEIQRLVSEFGSTPVVIVADTDELQQIVKALELGVKGYIPSSIGIEICVEAIKLALAGGVFVPASSVLAMRQSIGSPAASQNILTGIFTARQAEVVEALRRGKANKIIAYELKLRESTVKVHIRNIMKKVKASNRTEVIYKINDLIAH